MATVDQQYTDLYKDYYRKGSSLDHKRNLSAATAVDHILTLSHGSKWQRLIDVGAGNGSVLAVLDKMSVAEELYGVEISESGVEKMKELGLTKLKAALVFDGYKIDYPDKFFDAAICLHVLEHVEHERLFLRELARVAKEIIIEIPLEGGVRISKSIQAQAENGHLNFYSVPSLLYLLETSGLNVEQHIVTTSSMAYEKNLYGGFRGTVKSLIRQSALKWFPNAAPWMFGYLLTVRCRAAL
ncbi:class I SAM-dependent methyltransferase [Bradyrhizobium tunisiense]|uniref:class I SAM-dependent methyltransferase n=1 Tax=Bradyrhizobium tunisiense TaxID=3278709 RepID=UPI0035DC2BDC